ncbi:MAG: ribosome maturation factor RimP [Brevinema sp.]
MNKESICQLIKNSIQSLDFILVECIINYGKSKDSLKIIIYHQTKKITSDDCSVVADIISRQLDIEDPFPRPYDLIVESPGLEREIKSIEEYHYFLNREFKIFLQTNADIISKESFIIVTLKAMNNDDTLSVIFDKQQVIIPLIQIKKAKLHCDYDKLLKKSK